MAASSGRAPRTAPPVPTCRAWRCSSPARCGSFCTLMGEPMNDDWLDLAALELVFTFPGLIFHTVLHESGGEDRASSSFGRWAIALVALYTAGAAMAIYFPAAIFGLVPAPVPLG